MVSLLSDFNQQVAEHHTIIRSFPPSQWDGGENWGKTKKNQTHSWVEIKLITKIEKKKRIIDIYLSVFIWRYI